MSAIVAIGGAPLMKAVAAYRALVPSEVWVLGLQTARDPTDQNLRSLEFLVQPLMQPYFAAEAQARVAAISAALTTLLLPGPALEPGRVLNAISGTMWKDVAASLALVAMLDSAHVIAPIELVVNDDGSALARTAVAWARARGLPSVTVPAQMPIRRPRRPIADKTIVTGERGAQAYRSLGADEFRLLHVASEGQRYGDGTDERARRRADAKATVTRALGWPETDFVVVFEPAADRVSALQPANGRSASFRAMFEAFAFARASVPDMRLAVVAAPSADGPAIAAQMATHAGLTPTDYVYAQADYDLWMAAADTSVSVDSTRSIAAAVAGVPAVNLWLAASWYLSPAFSAEDGVLDISPGMLSATLVALASNAGLRTQIAAIAGAGIASEGTTAHAAIVIAGELVKHRQQATAIPRKPEPEAARREVLPTDLAINKQRYATQSIGRKPRPDIVIYAPPYTNGSAGLQALYRLCHFINLLGGNASMYPGNQLHPSWNTPRRDTELTERTIVVYPEIFHHALESKRIVRWCLNKPGLLGGPKVYGPNEMVFYYHQAYREAAQAATAEALTDERELQLALVEPELFYDDRSRSRLYDCAFVYKGQALYDRVQPREIRDAYMIHGGWPASRTETAALLRGCRRLYSFDWSSAIVMEAVICGVDVFLIQEDGSPIYTGGVDDWRLADYARQYYDIAPVERFLKQLAERWPD